MFYCCLLESLLFCVLIIYICTINRKPFEVLFKLGRCFVVIFGSSIKSKGLKVAFASVLVKKLKNIEIFHFIFRARDEMASILFLNLGYRSQICIQMYL